MARRRMKAPMSCKTRRVLGRVWCRMTCGTCGSRSGWRRPQASRDWINRHAAKSSFCTTKEPR